MRQVVLSWSGGKDAAWALHTLRQQQGVEVVALITTVTEGYDRVSMQGIGLPVLRAQADATGLPVVEARMPQRVDNAGYEASLAAGLDEVRLRWPSCTAIAFGDLFLADVRAFREAYCARRGWEPMFPVFGVDTTALAAEMVAAGVETYLCCVDTTQLAATFAGRRFDAALLRDLPSGVDPCGERGEFHTCVAAGPMFARALRLQRGETRLRDGRFAYTDFILADA